MNLNHPNMTTLAAFAQQVDTITKFKKPPPKPKKDKGPQKKDAQGRNVEQDAFADAPQSQGFLELKDNDDESTSTASHKDGGGGGGGDIENIAMQKKEAPLATKGAREMGGLWETMADRANGRPRATGAGDPKRPKRVSEENPKRKSEPGSVKRKAAAEAMKARKKDGVRLGPIKTGRGARPPPGGGGGGGEEEKKNKETIAGSKGGEWWRQSDSGVVAPPRTARVAPTNQNKNKRGAGGGGGDGGGEKKKKAAARPKTAPAR